MLLLGVELFDELYSGVPSVGAAAIQQSFAASYQLTAWVLVLVPSLVAMAIEPVLFLLADRHPRKWFVCGGLVGMSASALVAAAAPDPYVLAGAVAVAWVSTGCGVSLAQATLIDANPEARERTLARWVFLGEIGDLAAPVLMAALAAVALGWRTAYLIIGAGLAVWAVAAIRTPFPAPAAPAGGASGGADDDDDEPGLREALVTALANRRLLFWLLGAALCDFLDELVVVFATLHLRDELGAGPLARSVVLAVFIIGSLVGLAITDRLLRWMPPIRLLIVSSATCGVLYVAWLASPSWPVAAVLMAGVGLTAAPLYPLTIAQAYAAMPGRSGAVNAAGHLFTPVQLAVPWLLGWIADTAGTRAALTVLLIQPVGLIILGVVAARRSRVSR